MDISRHPSFQQLKDLILELAKDVPCEECKELKDQLNGAKSQAKTWETKFAELEKTLSGQKKEIPAWLIEILCQGKSLDELDNLLSVSTYWKVQDDKLVPHQFGQPGMNIRIKIEKISDDTDYNTIDNTPKTINNFDPAQE